MRVPYAYNPSLQHLLRQIISGEFMIDRAVRMQIRAEERHGFDGRIGKAQVVQCRDGIGNAARATCAGAYPGKSDMRMKAAAGNSDTRPACCAQNLAVQALQCWILYDIRKDQPRLVTAKAAKPGQGDDEFRHTQRLQLGMQVFQRVLWLIVKKRQRQMQIFACHHPAQRQSKLGRLQGIAGIFR